MDDFSLAYRFLSFADTLRPSVQAKFLIGATAFGIAQLALTETSKVKDKIEGCRLVKLGTEMLVVAHTVFIRSLRCGRGTPARLIVVAPDYAVIREAGRSPARLRSSAGVHP